MEEILRKKKKMTMKNKKMQKKKKKKKKIIRVSGWNTKIRLTCTSRTQLVEELTIRRNYPL